MWVDPIVEEVRRHREAHAAKFNFDLAAICRDLRQQPLAPSQTLTRLPGKRADHVSNENEAELQVHFLVPEGQS